MTAAGTAQQVKGKLCRTLAIQQLPLLATCWLPVTSDINVLANYAVCVVFLPLSASEHIDVFRYQKVTCSLVLGAVMPSLRIKACLKPRLPRIEIL